jgi:hypothetical protein
MLRRKHNGTSQRLAVTIPSANPSKLYRGTPLRPRTLTLPPQSLALRAGPTILLSLQQHLLPHQATTASPRFTTTAVVEDAEGTQVASVEDTGAVAEAVLEGISGVVADAVGETSGDHEVVSVELHVVSRRKDKPYPPVHHVLDMRSVGNHKAYILWVSNLTQIIAS